MTTQRNVRAAAKRHQAHEYPRHGSFATLARPECVLCGEPLFADEQTGPQPKRCGNCKTESYRGRETDQY